MHEHYWFKDFSIVTFSKIFKVNWIIVKYLWVFYVNRFNGIRFVFVLNSPRT